MLKCFESPVLQVIVQELLFPKRVGDKHHLQTVSLCGRKAVSWSDPVPLEFLHRVHLASGASSCEILLSAVSASLRDYFRYLGFKVGNSNKSYLLSKSKVVTSKFNLFTKVQ